MCVALYVDDDISARCAHGHVSEMTYLCFAVTDTRNWSVLYMFHQSQSIYSTKLHTVDKKRSNIQINQIKFMLAALQYSCDAVETHNIILYH